MNILKKTFTVGVLDIDGIFTTVASALNFYNEDERYAYSHLCKIEGGANWMGWYMDPAYRADVSIKGINELYVVYSTRNVADNVGIREIESVMRCILDNDQVVAMHFFAK